MKNNLALRSLFVANSIFVFALVLFGPLFAVYVQKMGGGVMMISIATAVSLLSTTLFLMFVARFGDRVERKEDLLVIAYLIRAIGFLAYPLVKDITWLMVLIVWLGAGEALGTPAFNVLFARHVDKKNEISEYADWHVVQNLIMALATILGGLFVSNFGFTGIFVAMSGLSFLAILVIKMTPKKIFN